MTTRVVSIISRMNVGGPAVLLADLISRLPTDEFTHTLITGVCEENEVDYLLSNSLNSEVIYLADIQRSLLPFNDIKSLCQLIFTLRKLNPEIVHTHTSKAGVLGRVAIRIACPNTKIIHTYHGHLLYGYFSNWKVSLLVKLEKSLAKISDALVAVTHEVMQDLKEVGIGTASKWHVIHPGVRFKSSQQLTKELGSKSGDFDFTISWVGRFTNIKNPLLAIQSFSLLQENSDLKLKFIMAGEGELWDEAKTLAHEFGVNIEFPGWISPIDKILVQSDLLLMTSKNEGMPVVIIEAAGYGIPTITTDVGGVKEFVSDYETGFLVSQETKEISRRLLEVVNDPDLITKVGTNAFELAHKDFSSETYLQSHLTLYRALKSH